MSQDPIGLLGNNPNVYSYVKDVNSLLDRLGLNVEYYPLDNLNRAIGGFAEVAQSTLGTGSAASVDTEGWLGGEHPYHQQRGHLIANNHGGSGNDIVPITDGTNHPGMSKPEGKITRHVKAKAGNTVLVEVKPNYTGNNPIPDSIRNGERITMQFWLLLLNTSFVKKSHRSAGLAFQCYVECRTT